MVKIAKPITRETATFDHTSPIVVTLYPKYLEIKLKGEKSSHTVPYDLVRKMAMRNGGK